MSSLRIEPISRRHRHLLKDFRNQEQSLVTYIRRFALRHAEKDRLAQTFLAIHGEQGTEHLAGYFSLSTVSVVRQSLDQSADLRSLPRFPVPGILLARLAVDDRVQGQGLGTYLFEEALGKTLAVARSGQVGFRLLVTDAISREASGFYRRFGFEQLSATYPARMVLDLKPILDALDS